MIYFMNHTKQAPRTLETKAVHKQVDVRVQAKTPETPMILEPSMQFVQSLAVPTQISTPPIQPIIKNKENIIIPQKSVSSFAPIKEVPLTPLSTPTIITSNQKVKASTINRDTEAFDIHEIEERFKNNSNPHLGLYIARYHYDHGNYTEAYNYALKTNAINNSIEESWLIFAKSLIKLGKAEQARKTLQLYISQSNSDSAKNLLSSLEKGDTK
jgi:hypothetical protein